MQTVFLKARRALETKGRFAHGAVPEAIGDSWRRCLRQGLDPRGTPIEAVVSHTEHRERRQAASRIMRFVRPELELLSSQIAGTNFLVAFADADGVVLDSIVDDEFRTSGVGRSIVAGSIWREELRGTNALGLSLHTGKPGIVTGREHFFTGHAGISCLSAPIFDSSGKIVGLIDASSEIATRQYHTHALVNLAAGNVENRLFVESHRDKTIILFHPREEYLVTQGVGMLALDEDGALMGANHRSAELLSGLDLTGARHFSDLFQGGFGPTFDALRKGETVRLVDWLNSMCFARIRLTRSARTGKGWHDVVLPLEAIVQENQTLSWAGPVFDDETLRYNLKLACKSARIGLPVLLSGAAGTGASETAREIHRRCHKEQNFVVIDCERVTQDAVTGHLVAQLHKSDVDDGAPGKIDLSAGGTLLLDGIERLPPDLVAIIEALLNRVLQRQGPILSDRDWVVLATSRLTGEPMEPPLKPLVARLSGFVIDLPAPGERQDFDKLARALLARISPGHTLSKSAAQELARSGATENLHMLIRQLQTIAVRSPEGIVRKETVARLLAGERTSSRPCARCAGQPIKERRCIEIQETLRRCKGNVALAARCLGISRNTVYSHRSGIERERIPQAERREK